VAAYRAAKMREKHAAEGSPLPPNHYDTTGWAKPMHPVYMYIYIYTYIHIYIYIYILKLKMIVILNLQVDLVQSLL